MNEEDMQLLEAAPLSLSAFIQIRDNDGGGVILNVREIVGVFELVGQALRAAPTGANARIMLRNGNNIPVNVGLEVIGALLAQVAVIAAAEVDETVTQPPTRIYTPDNNR